MTPARLQPGSLSWHDDGTPCSTDYGDVYHTRSGGPAQARNVFLAGNLLPERWRRRRRFIVLETGFGLGLNFLATWVAWREDPQRCTRLHFVSVEKHPLQVHELSQAHGKWPELAAAAADLRAAWPVLTPGFHRLQFDDGQVVLTLLLGDVLAQLRELECRADAIFLDGFAPSRNPEMWSAPVCHELARLSATDATLATWSVSADLRRNLAVAGFDCEKRPGNSTKRELLHGRRQAAQASPLTQPEPARQALVIGAGLAGTSVAARLAARGWQVTLIDGASGAGLGASGNHAGVLRPLPSLDDNRLARLTRAGSLYGAHMLDQLLARGLPVRWDACGVLHLARDADHQRKQADIVAAHAYPPAYLRFVSRQEASALAGWPVDSGGWWFPRGGWVQPHSLCRANLATSPDLIRCLFSREVARIDHIDGLWQAHAAGGVLIAAAPVLILATGASRRRFPVTEALPVGSARGQVAHLPVAPPALPKVVVCRGGYVSPPIDGVVCAGATFSMADPNPDWCVDDHAANLATLDAILPGYSAAHRHAPPQGRVGFRPTSPDRLPMVGAVPLAAPAAAGASLTDLPRYPGLSVVSGFGARGLVWAELVAETLASQLEGDPLPLERGLVDAIDPGRFVLRPARKRAYRDD